MAKMKPYVIKTGDYLTALAFRYAFDAEEVWEDAKNEELRQLRSNPDILCPGDLLWIPDKPRPPGTLTAKTTNAYAAAPPLVTVRVLLSDGQGPLRSANCVVEGVADAPTATDAEGILTVEVPVTTSELTVTLPERLLSVVVKVGHLAPETTITGAQARLAHLGYFGGEVDGRWDERSALAMRNFQMDHELTVDGRLGAASAEALRKAHGS